ncbi:hypothetical protein ACFL42_03100 [Candidatus Omnitrophota bacterium]
MKWLMILIILLFVFSNPASAEEFSSWEWEAGRMWLSDFNYGNCRMRTFQLAQMMENTGMTTGVDFKIIFGYYRSRPHCWIEIDNGKKIDASVAGHKEYYKRYSVKINKNKSTSRSKWGEVSRP